MRKHINTRKKPIIQQDEEQVAVLKEIRAENTELWSMNYKTEEQRAIALTQMDFLYYKEHSFITRAYLVQQLGIHIDSTNYSVNYVKSEIEKTEDPTKLEDLQIALKIWEAHLQKLQNWKLRLPLTADTELSIWHAISTLADVIDHHLTSSRTSSP
jgi:ribosomal protein S19E (S16A)